MCVCSFTGNSNLGKGEGKKLGVIIGASVGASVLLIATVFSCIWLCKANKNSKRKTSGTVCLLACVSYGLLCYFTFLFLVNLQLSLRTVPCMFKERRLHLVMLMETVDNASHFLRWRKPPKSLRRGLVQEVLGLCTTGKHERGRRLRLKFLGITLTRERESSKTRYTYMPICTTRFCFFA